MNRSEESLACAERDDKIKEKVGALIVKDTLPVN
jgi:hypothetical protein